MSGLKHRRVALVHDWLTGMRGGEKVLEVLCDLFPQADIFTLVHVPGQVSPKIEAHRILTSPLQRFPNVGAYYRHLLPLMPWAIERFDFSGYDLLISTSHCVAKAAKPAKGARHVSYCHTPMRYIWDQYDAYFAPGRASWPVRMAMKSIRPSLQRWDVATVPRVRDFIANSHNVSERIKRIYKRDSVVIYPPVDYEFYSEPSPGLRSPLPEGRGPTSSAFSLQGEGGRHGDPDEGSPEPFYLIVSALAPYKRVDIAIDAFKQLGKRLVVIGEGQESQALRAMAGNQIEFRGWQSDEQLRSHYQTCEALIFPGEEDFGIVPVEAMAAGCPVIALRKGGALETVKENQTGIFFDQPTAQSLIAAISRFEQMSFDPIRVREQARTFSRTRCEAEFRSFFIEYRDEMS